MPVIIPNPFWPQVASRGQNPESLLSGGHPGTKSFQMTPQSPFYMAWRPRFTPANAEFSIVIHSLGKPLLLPYTLVSLVLDFTQMVLAAQKHLEMAITMILNNPEQPLLMQFFQKFTLWGSPCSCPTPWCLWGWTSPRWSWLSGNTLKWPL